MFEKISIKALLILLVAYIVFIVISMYHIKHRITLTLDYSVRVTQETREIKTRILEMQNTMPGLLSTADLSAEDSFAGYHGEIAR